MTALCRLALRRFELGLPAPGTDLASFSEAPVVGTTATDLMVMGLDTDTEEEPGLERTSVSQRLFFA